MIFSTTSLIFHIIMCVLRNQLKVVSNGETDSTGTTFQKIFLSIIPIFIFALIVLGGIFECLRCLFFISQVNKVGITYDLVLHGISSIIFIAMHRGLLSTDKDIQNNTFNELSSKDGEKSMYHEYFEISCIAVYVLKRVLSK